MVAEKTIDKKDREIVALLRDDAWLTHTQIGERVNLSPSTVQRRIDRLRGSGVITGARATIDPSALQGPTRLYLLLELNDDSRPSLDGILDSLSARDEITGVDVLAGAFDVLLTVDCDNIEAFFSFAMTALNENNNIRHCTTLTRLKQMV